MSKQKGMSMTGALVLIALGAMAGVTAKNAVGGMADKLTNRIQAHPTTMGTCVTEDGGGVTIMGTGFNTGSVTDIGCATRQSSTIAPDEARKEFMWCSTPEAQRAFGTVKNCLAYNGDNDTLIAQVQSMIDYCERRSKKWYKRVTLQRNRSYDRCMNKYRGA